MHFSITGSTSLLMAFLTVHDSILGEALLSRTASRLVAALEVAVTLRRLEGEIEVSD